VNKFGSSVFALALFFALSLTCASAARAGGATRTLIASGIGLANPCSGEIVIVEGPGQTIYEENLTEDGATHYQINGVFRGTGTGSFGNVYHVSLRQGGQFDAPTEDFGSYQTFLTNYKADFVSEGTAPNFSAEGTLKVFVAGGQSVGGIITSLTVSRCQ